jgi:DNA-binding MarR family transcriptional regulator
MSGYNLHQRLGYRVSRLSRIMQGRLEAVLAEHGITRLMWCVVIGIGEEEVRTPSDLADYVGVTRPAMSRLLRTLEKKGFLQRRSGNGRDGRSVEIELTEAGLHMMRTTRGPVDAMNAHFTQKLDPEHLRQVLLGLELLAAGERDELTDF